jgi:hypothetical protein
LRKNICYVRSIKPKADLMGTPALRASLRQQGSVILEYLTALFRFAHPWLKAMGYQVVP